MAYSYKRRGFCKLADVETDICAFPSSPRFVVTKMTPLAPRTPNTAVAEASFNTVTFSISLGSRRKKERSTPSTMMSGAALFASKEPMPRTNMAGSSAPG